MLVSIVQKNESAICIHISPLFWISFHFGHHRSLSALFYTVGFPNDSEMQDLIPRSGRSPRGENGNPLQYSCLKNPMDRGAWWATVQRVAKSQTWLSNWAHIFLSDIAVTHFAYLYVVTTQFIDDIVVLNKVNFLDVWIYLFYINLFLLQLFLYWRKELLTGKIHWWWFG